MTPQSKPNRLLLPALVVWSVWLGGCSQDKPQGGSPKTEVGVVTLQKENVVLQSELPGRTVPSLISEVRPQVSGIVKARLFQEGATVKAGQLLYQIESSSYQAAYDEAKADLVNAEAGVTASKLKYERYAELLDIEGVSKQDADDAQATYQQALASVALKKAALQSAQINLDYTRIRAPISGKISKSNVTAGALVTANQETALATIRALDPIYVDLTQSSTQMLRLRKLLNTNGMSLGSMSMRLKLEDGSDYGRTGTLESQEVAVDEATGSVTLRAQFANPDSLLLPGMYVRAVLDEAVSSAALLVPQQSVSRDTKGNALAMVIGKDDKVEQRMVVVDRAVGNKWLITEGLNAGERVVVEGLGKIRAGQAVQVVSIDSNTGGAEVRTADATSDRSGAAAKPIVGNR